MFQNLFFNKNDPFYMFYAPNYQQKNNFTFQLETLKIKNKIQKLQKTYLQRKYQIIYQMNSIILKNSSLIDILSQNVDSIDNQLENLAKQFQFINKKKQNQEQTLSQISITQNQKLKEASNKNCGRIHYKTIFMEKVFGIKQYKYRLVVQKSLSLIFFKQRNISFCVNLLNKNGQNVINQHAISLNLKVFYSNGEQVQQTKKGGNFIKGTTTTLMMRGKASFDKLYPRQVTSKLQKKKVIIVIYASKMGNAIDSNIVQIDPEQIEPFILYGIKVITKQKQKIQMQEKKRIDLNDISSQFNG